MHLGISSPELSAVILAALLAFLALLVILFFAARYYFRRKMRRWTTQSTALSLQWLPPRIELERRDAPSQAKLDRVARRVAALQELGFEDAGVFRLADEYGLWLQALAHRTTGLTAVVYCLDNVGTWSDVFHVNAANNEVLMASNVRKRFHFIHLPGDRRFHLPDKGEGELVETVLKERGAAASKPVDRERFGAFYERA